MNRRVTFNQQSKLFMQHATHRARRPIKPATVRSFQNCLDKWLNPHLGEFLLLEVNNGSVRTLVSRMREAGLSAQSIVSYVGIVKLVVASALDDEGQEVFPRKWNSDFMDLPLIKNQRQTTVTPETMSAIVERAKGQYGVLFAFLASTGLRIGEAIGLEVGKHFSPSGETVYVRQSVWEGDIQLPKTVNAIRDVDMDPMLVEQVQKLIGKRSKGFLFQNRAGGSLHQSNTLRKHLHPVLQSVGAEKMGYHTFRRFRATHLRKNRVPEGLIRYYMGHASLSITDCYDKSYEDIAWRKGAIEHIGVGFNLPSELKSA